MANQRLRNVFRIFALALTVLLGSSLANTSSFAATSRPLVREQAIVQKVMSAKDHRAAYLALSPADRELFKDSFRHMTPTLTSEHGGALTAAQAVAMGLHPAGAGVHTNTAASSGCWYHYFYYTWNDFFIDDGHTWMQLNWCGSGGSITSYYASHVGGQGLAGVSYKGVVGHDSYDVGWEVRQYEMYDFGFYGFVDANPCMQIRGGATGLYSTRTDCNLS